MRMGWTKARRIGATLPASGVAVILSLLFAAGASGYHHFLHYRSVDGTLVAAPEKFDLRALPADTVQYFLSLEGPEKLAPGDNYQAVVSQIRAAAESWNAVSTSALRLRFGGFRDPNAASVSPGIDVVFEEMPPGVVALGGPTVRAEKFAEDAQGSFLPILRSVVKLNKDLTSRPSYSERFFLTVTHEFGHALGLQHTLTSSVMSTEITRSTSKAKPLDLDDEVGISLLYPAKDFLRKRAGISGKVTLNGAGVHMASVVAVGTVQSPVSVLTLPDGSYRLEGLAPGFYHIYVHPLPPPVYGEVTPANVVLPKDEAGNPVPIGATFASQFFGGSDVTPVQLREGDRMGGVDFQVTAAASIPVHSVQSYSYYTTEPIKPGYFVRSASAGALLVSGVGLVNQGRMTPDLKINVLNGGDIIPQEYIQPYAPAPSFLLLYSYAYPWGGYGARHLVFSVPNNFYVLPNAYRWVARRPPSISSVEVNPADERGVTATLRGSDFDADSRVWFDGQEASVLDVAEDRITVRVPAALSAHQARVAVFNSDGQSSLFLKSEAPVVNYGDQPPLNLTVSPATLVAGAEQAVEIQADNGRFEPGAVSLGFGSSDITVTGLWVVSSSKIVANVFVSPSAQPGAYPLTVLSGLALVSLPRGVQVEAPGVPPLALSSRVRNLATGEKVLYAGAPVAAAVSNLAEGDSQAWAVKVGEESVPVESVENGWIRFRLPAGLPEGLVMIRLSSPGAVSPPITIQIHRQPPIIAGVRRLDGTVVTLQSPAIVDSSLVLLVENLGPVPEGGNPPELSPQRFTVLIGGVEERVESVVPLREKPGWYAVTFVVSQFVTPGEAVPVSVWFDGNPSVPVSVPVVPRPPDMPARTRW